jgi:hypothetical protein
LRQSEPTSPAVVNIKNEWAKWVGKLPTDKTMRFIEKIATWRLITASRTGIVGKYPPNNAKRVGMMGKAIQSPSREKPRPTARK